MADDEFLIFTAGIMSGIGRRIDSHCQHSRGDGKFMKYRLIKKNKT